VLLHPARVADAGGLGATTACMPQTTAWGEGRGMKGAAAAAANTASEEGEAASSTTTTAAAAAERASAGGSICGWGAAGTAPPLPCSLAPSLGLPARSGCGGSSCCRCRLCCVTGARPLEHATTPDRGAAAASTAAAATSDAAEAEGGLQVHGSAKAAAAAAAAATTPLKAARRTSAGRGGGGAAAAGAATTTCARGAAAGRRGGAAASSTTTTAAAAAAARGGGKQVSEGAIDVALEVRLACFLAAPHHPANVCSALPSRNYRTASGSFKGSPKGHANLVVLAESGL
jgi:hypothetical protein